MGNYTYISQVCGCNSKPNEVGFEVSVNIYLIY